MIDEGYVKYKCYWQAENTVTSNEIKELNQWRERLYKLGLIGEYENGIGFGNISIRSTPPKQFLITGTKTGGLPILTENHYTKVIDFDWERNFITCAGPIAASSEALTHAAVYVANPEINAVIHVHHLKLWEKLIDIVPTTARDCAYGTPQMAEEIIRLCREEDLKQTKILVMSGHREGIISFGQNLDEAGNILLDYFSSKEASK